MLFIGWLVVAAWVDDGTLQERAKQVTRTLTAAATAAAGQATALALVVLPDWLPGSPEPPFSGQLLSLPFNLPG